MLVKRVSSITGIEHEMELDIVPQQMANFLNGVLVQDAFPNLNDDEREFILTGITPEEWKGVFGDDED